MRTTSSLYQFLVISTRGCIFLDESYKRVFIINNEQKGSNDIFIVPTFTCRLW